MNYLAKTASAVALVGGLVGPFATAEAGGEYYPYGAYRARHGDHHHGHHGGRDGSYAAGVVTRAVAGVLLGVQPYRPYYPPAPVYVAPRPVYVPQQQPVYVYQEPVYVPAPAPAPRVPTRPNICDDYNRCAPAYREVVIEGMRCRANDFAAQCPNGHRFALDAN